MTNSTDIFAEVVEKHFPDGSEAERLQETHGCGDWSDLDDLFSEMYAKECGEADEDGEFERPSAEDERRIAERACRKHLEVLEERADELVEFVRSTLISHLSHGGLQDPVAIYRSNGKMYANVFAGTSAPIAADGSEQHLWTLSAGDYDEMGLCSEGLDRNDPDYYTELHASIADFYIENNYDD